LSKKNTCEPYLQLLAIKEGNMDFKELRSIITDTVPWIKMSDVRVNILEKRVRGGVTSEILSIDKRRSKKINLSSFFRKSKYMRQGR